MNKNVCRLALVLFFLYTLYYISNNYNKKVGGEKHDEIQNANALTESDLDSDSEFDDNNYGPEPILDDEGNVPTSDIDTSNVVPQKAEVVNQVAAKKQDFNVAGFNDEDNYQFVNSEDNKGNKKIKPNELLPANSVNMEDNNFLTETLSKTEQIIGIPTQMQRSRKNYDLRSSPPNPQVEVSPWNMSTMEPDTERLQFEIGTSKCVCE